MQMHVFIRNVEAIDPFDWLRFQNYIKHIVDGLADPFARHVYEYTGDYVGEIRTLPSGEPKPNVSGIEFFRVGEVGTETRIVSLSPKPRNNMSVMTSVIALGLAHYCPGAYTWHVKGWSEGTFETAGKAFGKVCQTHLTIELHASETLGEGFARVDLHFGDEAEERARQVERNPEPGQVVRSLHGGSKGSVRRNVHSDLKDFDTEVERFIGELKQLLTEIPHEDSDEPNLLDRFIESARELRGEGGERERVVSALIHTTFNEGNLSEITLLSFPGGNMRGQHIPYRVIEALKNSKVPVHSDQMDEAVRSMIRTILNVGIPYVIAMMPAVSARNYTESGVLGALYTPSEGLSASVMLKFEGGKPTNTAFAGDYLGTVKLGPVN